MKKTLSILIVVMLSICFCFACQDKTVYTDGGNELKALWPEYLFLDKGETETINVKEVFNGFDFKVYKYELTSNDEEIATLNGNKVTAYKAGLTEIVATIYDKKNAAKYENVIIAQVRVIDLEDMTEIRTPEELSAIRDNVRGNFILKNDIDMTGIDWKPIGWYNRMPVSISFDGVLINRGGYKIKNLTVSEGNGDGAFSYSGTGLFGLIGMTGYIEGLILENANILHDGWGSGGIAWESTGVIRNCIVSGNVESATIAGGICARNGYASPRGGIHGYIINCEFNGVIRVEGDDTGYAGGIVGINALGGYINNCRANGEIYCSGFAGGIVGFLDIIYGLTVKDNYFEGIITASVWNWDIGKSEKVTN